MATSAEGRSIEKLATLLTTSSPTSPVRKASNSRCRSLTGVSPLITGAPSTSATSSIWSMYWPITRVGWPGCESTISRTTSILWWVHDASR